MTKDQVLVMHRKFMDEGATLRELAAENGISHERVRQLFEEHGLAKRKPWHVLRRERNEEIAEERRDEIIEVYKDKGSLAATAAEVELPLTLVRNVIQSFPLAEAYRNHSSAKAWTKDQILASIKYAAAVIGEPLSRNAYQSHAPDYNMPAHYTIERHFGSWHEACKQAGVQTYDKRATRSWSISQEDCATAIRQCAEKLGRVPSYSAYDSWAKSNDAPSGSTVRNKFGSWKYAVARSFPEHLTVV